MLFRSPKAKAAGKPKKAAPVPKKASAPGRNVAKKPAAKPTPPPPPVRPSGAVAALESGIRLMFSEEYEKAIKVLNKVVQDFPQEAEIQASARARITACEKKIQEKARSVFRSADDHYNVAVAFLNGGQLEPAITHLQSALKLSPRADHILYAMAAAQALQGNTDHALTHLKQAIVARPENRIQASADPDFASLSEEQSFKELLAPPEK